jgi:transcriptional activator SPT7
MSMPFKFPPHSIDGPSYLSNGEYHDDRIARISSHTAAQSKDATPPEPANVEGDNLDDHQRAVFRALFERSEAKIARLFGGHGGQDENPRQDAAEGTGQFAIEDGNEPEREVSPPKKPARTIDEDDYDDDDDDDDDDDEGNTSPSKKPALALLSPSKSGSSPPQPESSPSKQPEKDKLDGAPTQPKTSEDVRKQLEEAKRATEDAVKRSFSNMFWLLDSDKIAMHEQQKLEESEKQIDAEMDRNPAANPEHHGTLSSANLGASSLTLKHLIARIDLKRDQVLASDAELRSLMNEVRKNRSKWASEENVGQEELYEAAEKVLSELKAMTEYSAPFLTRVNKREAPDYYNCRYLSIFAKRLKNLTISSHQASNGPWHDDQEAEDSGVQVQSRIRR